MISKREIDRNYRDSLRFTECLIKLRWLRLCFKKKLERDVFLKHSVWTHRLARTHRSICSDNTKEIGSNLDTGTWCRQKTSSNNQFRLQTPVSSIGEIKLTELICQETRTDGLEVLSVDFWPADWSGSVSTDLPVQLDQNLEGVGEFWVHESTRNNPKELEKIVRSHRNQYFCLWVLFFEIFESDHQKAADGDLKRPKYESEEPAHIFFQFFQEVLGRIPLVWHDEMPWALR